jgi:hypothetical protein
MARPTNKKHHEIAARFDVSLRTVRNWEEKGYPLDDEGELCNVLIAQHSRPRGVDAVYHERKQGSGSATNEWRDTIAKLGSMIHAYTAVRGPEANWPWPFGGGVDLTEEETAKVKALRKKWHQENS